MKKIVSAVALASLVAGAFAADVTVKSEVKYQPEALQFYSGKDAQQTNFATQGTFKDTVQINLKQDNVKINGKFDVQNGNVNLNTGSAILTWGAANFTAAYTDSRFANRVTNDQNDLSLIEQNYGGKVWNGLSNTAVGTGKIGGYNEGWSLGSINGTKKLGINPNLSLTSKAGQDADNATATQGIKADAFVFDYTIADVLPGKLMFKLATKKSAKAWNSQTLADVDGAGNEDDIKSETNNNSAYSIESTFTHDAFAADFIVNLDADQVGSWGLYVNPTCVDGLTSVFGFTYAWNKRNSTAAGGKLDYTYWAVDARARYAINDDLAAGVYINATNYTEKKNDVKVYDGLTALDVVLNVNYKLNDLAKVFVEGEYAAKSLSNQDADANNASLKVVGAKYGTTNIVAQAGVILTPAKGATLTAAVRGVFGGIGAGEEGNVKYSDFVGNAFTIPVTFKCSL